MFAKGYAIGGGDYISALYSSKAGGSFSRQSGLTDFLRQLDSLQVHRSFDWPMSRLVTRRRLAGGCWRARSERDRALRNLLRPIVHGVLCITPLHLRCAAHCHPTEAPVD